MDEGVKISKSKIWPIIEMADLHIKSAFKKSKIFAAFILLAAEVSSYTNLDAVLKKTRITNLKPSPMQWRAYI